MTDAKLYVDRVAVASAFDSISSIDAIIFGREAGGVVNERRPGGAIGSAKHAASKVRRAARARVTRAPRPGARATARLTCAPAPLPLV